MDLGTRIDRCEYINSREKKDLSFTKANADPDDSTPLVERDNQRNPKTIQKQYHKFHFPPLTTPTSSLKTSGTFETAKSEKLFKFKML